MPGALRHPGRAFHRHRWWVALAVLAGALAAPPDPVPMQLKLTSASAEFLTATGQLAGRYNFADAFKPFVHPLQSPRGHCVTLVSPHDHKHHKGLMYALRVPEVNFWEEFSTLPGEKVGRQRHVAFTEVSDSGAEVGFTETLSWETAEGGEPWFDETRRITCRQEGAAFVWTWSTTLKARRATKLIQSQWSHQRTDGSKINYHGLGLRLRRDFGGGTRNNALQLDDGPVHANTNKTPFDFTTAMGATPKAVTFTGSIDGVWPVPQVAVTMTQQQANGLFVVEVPFAFFALGPSNLAERPVAAGETLQESYTVTVKDL